MTDEPSTSKDQRQRNGGTQARQDDGLKRRYQSLSDQLDQVVVDDKDASAQTGQTTGTEIGRGLKMGTEFVAGVLVGAGIGWLIDQFFGTTPLGLIVFLLLGFGAGVLNVLRSANLVAEAGIRSPHPTAGEDNEEKKL